MFLIRWEETVLKKSESLQKQGKKEEDKDAIVGVTVEQAEGEKCERCWMYSKTVGQDTNHPHICKRCSDNLQ